MEPAQNEPAALNRTHAGGTRDWRALIDCPMGLASRNGTWQQKVRNLAADLAQAKPGETPAVVRYLSIRGSGRFDDIQLGIQ